VGRVVLRWALLIIVPIAAFFTYLTQPLIHCAPSASRVDVDPERLARHVRMLTTTLGPRDAAHPEQLDAVAGYLREELASVGGRVSEQAFVVAGETYRNVLASFGPTEAECIVVGAHYDTCGPYPGADDNASGVAGLLELGRLLGQTPPATRVELVAFTLEEPPYFGTPSMGSVFHAAQLKRNEVPLRAMLSLEMIGCFSDAAGSQRYPSPALAAFYPSEGNFIAVVGELGGGNLVRRIKRAMTEATVLSVRSLNAPRFALGIGLSDHASYWEAGYDAVMVTDTAFFRNGNYHSAADTLEMLDLQRMAQVVQGVHAAVIELAR
jgi:hypothetical protein